MRRPYHTHEEWAEVILNHRMYTSGEWIRPAYLSNDVNASKETICNVLKKMHDAGLVERRLMRFNGRDGYWYKRPTPSVLHSPDWRKRTNDELGIADASMEWH